MANFSVRTLTGLLLLLAAISAAGQVRFPEPISGADFDSLMEKQNIPLQKALKVQFGNIPGCLITGPLAPTMPSSDSLRPLLDAVRVVFPDHKSFAKAAMESPRLNLIVGQIGFRGNLFEFDSSDIKGLVMYISPHQNRYLIWMRHFTSLGWNTVNSVKLRRYAVNISDHFLRLDSRGVLETPPSCAGYRIPETLDLLPPLPALVIAREKDFLDSLKAYNMITTGFFTGDSVIIAVREVIDIFKNLAPRMAFPDKEEFLLQRDFISFLEKGGNFSLFKTLDSLTLASMPPGEYKFAVGLNGDIRLAPRYLKAASKGPSANTEKFEISESLLFPGDPVMSAGILTIKDNQRQRISHFNILSKHYFFSPYQPTFSDILAQRSNDYLLSLGYLFKALDELKINYEGARISKF